MNEFIFGTFEGHLKRLSLYQVVINIQYYLPHSSFHFFSILEMYNAEPNTLFTPVGELGFMLHEMHKV